MADNEHLVDGKYAIGDLVDLCRLQDVFEKFTLATGYTIGFLDHPGLNILAATGWRDICTEFHRACPASAEVCRKSNEHLLEDLNQPGEVVVEECEHGLVDCATPIIIKGKHVASLATGQLLLRPPDDERFKGQARRFGYDKEKYLRALSEVPVVSAEKLKAVTAFLGALAGMISEQGYASLAAMARAKESLDRESAERRKAEQRAEQLNNELLVYSAQLAESRDFLSSIIDSVADPIFVKDRLHRWVLLNKAYCEFMGYTREELIGKSDTDFFPKEEAEVFWAKDEEVFKSGKTNVNEEKFTDSKGRLHVIVTKKELYRDAEGKEFIVGVIRDVTGSKRVEAGRVS
ncbi:MAG: PocR ligand-binding domain-containing protein [Elusimicrobia bacterium]|nr:PocR ligand-binding domain-containing protein [Elusimicrobiota bacterium]